MTASDNKAKSRGISADMSPQAISRRLEIVSELYELSKTLDTAKFVGKVEPTKNDQSTDNDST